MFFSLDTGGVSASDFWPASGFRDIPHRLGWGNVVPLKYDGASLMLFPSNLDSENKRFWLLSKNSWIFVDRIIFIQSFYFYFSFIQNPDINIEQGEITNVGEAVINQKSFLVIIKRKTLCHSGNFIFHCLIVPLHAYISSKSVSESDSVSAHHVPWLRTIHSIGCIR